MSNGYDIEQEADGTDPDQAPEILDAGEPGFRRQRLTKEARHRLDVERFWQGVFESPIGRHEMWRILEDCGAFDVRFGVGPNGFPQAEASWVHTGKRAIGLGLWRNWMVFAREGVWLMHDEHDPRFRQEK